MRTIKPNIPEFEFELINEHEVLLIEIPTKAQTSLLYLGSKQKEEDMFKDNDYPLIIVQVGTAIKDLAIGDMIFVTSKGNCSMIPLDADRVYKCPLLTHRGNIYAKLKEEHYDKWALEFNNKIIAIEDKIVKTAEILAPKEGAKKLILN